MVVHCIIRHFKTLKGTEKINYASSYSEAEPFIKKLKKLIINNNIELIKIKTSPQDRAVLTALILFIKLKDILSTDSTKIIKPEIDKYLDRDPSKNNTDKIIKYYIKYCSKKSKSDKVLVINITHSSVYQTIYKAMLDGMTNKNNELKKEKIHANSLSFIEYISNDKLNWKFNIQMGKKDNKYYNT